MTQGDRERMINALLRGMPAEPAGIYQDFEEMCSSDLDTLEPIIDEIVARERKQAVEAERCKKSAAA